MPDLQIAKACEWFQADIGKEDQEHCCLFRDVFQTRLNSMYNIILKKIKNPNAAALLAALTGEIGNNSFDHNLGQWRDVPGCWFNYGFEKNYFWVFIADRGRGIYQSLKAVEPSLKNDQQAIDMAFTKVISGRFPEKRGNGLKFVSSIMNHSQPRGLFCISGSGLLALGQKGEEARNMILPHLSQTKDFGTLSFILWEA